MKTLYALGIIAVAYFAIANCAPLFGDDFEKLFESFKIDCTKELDCPQGSTSCSKNVTTSEDRKTIMTQIKCFNSEGQLLNSGNDITTKPNINPNGIHNSYEYYGSYTGGSNTVHTTNYGSSNPDPSNTNIETFDV